jgi:DNA-binding PadR family transcriptional regulator
MTRGSDGCGPKWGWKRRGPFGGPPPFMRGGFPFGPKSSRMFGQGDLRLLLLALIADQPSHGYDLIRTIEARFAGSYSPSPGTIYPTLTLLEEQELISAEPEAGGKKSYRATEKGRAFLAENAAQVKALMARIDLMAGSKSASFPPESVMHAVMTLRHAIFGKPGGWGETEEKRVAAILEKAARDIVAGSAE